MKEKEQTAPEPMKSINAIASVHERFIKQKAREKARNKQPTYPAQNHLVTLMDLYDAKYPEAAE
jgi:hypothetical protein